MSAISTDPLSRMIALARPRSARFALGVLLGAAATGSGVALLGVAVLAGLAFFAWFKMAGPGQGNTDQDVFPWRSAPLAFAAMVGLFMLVRGGRHLYKSIRA